MYELHIAATWLHVIAAVYWIGAILFVLSVLGPIMRKKSGAVALPIMSEVQGRVRRFVLVAIVIFVGTGMFNMHYRGLWDVIAVAGDPYARIFLLKMIPVSIMLCIYFSAPMILKKLSPDSKGTCCELEDGPKPVGKVFAALHVLALFCGLTTVLLGVMLRG